MTRTTNGNGAQAKALLGISCTLLGFVLSGAVQVFGWGRVSITRSDVEGIVQGAKTDLLREMDLRDQVRDSGITALRAELLGQLTALRAEVKGASK